ncbi:acyl-CoA-binding domain-containing protein 5A isoform X2 [Myripristis murdjan]|uniref:Acyl-CoA-binding domain-containing protein 5 n=1 Tax=Myripristis murdjan TaxID=586833 RepID=A0A667YQ03_9TELE|nr:acyl-CoA-binding domain-containing protein 5 isoform X2 [Myripristis murdjan]
MMECVSVQDERRVTELRFEAAVKVIKSLPPDGSFQPSNDMMLKFYSYYKQATVGPCNIPRPGFWDAVGKAKWDAWNSLGDMPKEEAMTAYVDEMKLILEGMPITDEVEELLRVLGPFYELVDEKKKITQISDLGVGFGTMLAAKPSKSVTKNIIRNLEMNGTLESRPARAKSKDKALEVRDTEEEEEEQEEDEEEEADEEEEDEEEEVVIKEVKKDKKAAASLPKKKGSARRNKMPLTNGKVANGVAHLTNGSHSKASLNSDDSQEGPVSSSEPQLNGHHIDPSGDVSAPNQLASDSDSEVYCDSVDQFGQDEGSDHNRSMDDLDEEENHVPPALEEPQALHETQEELHGPPEGIRCGGEDGDTSGTISQRQRLNANMPDGSLVRRGRGSRSPGLGSGALGPMQGGGDGDGERWGGAGTHGVSLNEQIVVALARLQEDMQSVLERLHTLEALTATQARSVALSPTYASPPVNKSSKKPTWWPFDISPSTLAFAVIWPFVVQWLIRLYLQRRRRRLN